MSFKAYVVRHKDPLDAKVEDFIKLDSIPRDLFSEACWQRNDIKAVHVIADTMGFVAEDMFIQGTHIVRELGCDVLRRLMLPIQQSVSDNVPDALMKRADAEKPKGLIDIGEARKHQLGGFEAEVARHAR